MFRKLNLPPTAKESENQRHSMYIKAKAFKAELFIFSSKLKIIEFAYMSVNLDDAENCTFLYFWLFSET